MWGLEIGGNGIMVLEIETKKYACGICHKSYDSKGDAEECEKRDNEEQRIENLSRVKNFFITEEHLKLLKRMYIDWDDCEYGAPAINPKRPYGNSDVEEDIKEIVKCNAGTDIYYLHRQMEIVLQIVLCTGQFKVGTYVKKDEYDSLSWEFVLSENGEVE